MSQMCRSILLQLPHWLLRLRGCDSPPQGLSQSCLWTLVSFRPTGQQRFRFQTPFHHYQIFRLQLLQWRLRLLGLSRPPRLLPQRFQRLPVPFHLLGLFHVLGQALIHFLGPPTLRPQAPTAQREARQSGATPAAGTSSRRRRASFPRPLSCRDSDHIRPARSTMAQPRLPLRSTAPAPLSPDGRCSAPSNVPPCSAQTFQATRPNGWTRSPGWPSGERTSSSRHPRRPIFLAGLIRVCSGALGRAAGRIRPPSTRTFQPANSASMSTRSSDAWRGSRPPRRFATPCWP